ncbi:MAG: PEP-CTERM sorting domain-containing protein [Acidimicrobiia bacterium]|nr:PEP-CTERM sorting domain-containing protein [Acidimicrobiia bacterium]
MRSYCRGLTTLVVICALAGGMKSHAGVICLLPGPPSACGSYVSDTPDGSFSATFFDGGATYGLGRLHLFNLINIVLTPSGPNELEAFDATLATGFTIIPPGAGGPIQLSGPVQVVAFNKTTNDTGTFQTEIVSMSLTGSGLILRESPTLPSNGSLNITNLGGGNYRIDSFFDVFVELSLDNGTTWIPQQESGGVRIELVPEPGTLSMLGLAGLALGFMARRRRI